MWVELASLAAFFGVLLIVLLWFMRRQRLQLTYQQKAITQQLEQTKQLCQQLQNEVEELRAGIIGVGQRVLNYDTTLAQVDTTLQQFEEQLNDMAQRQQAMELTDPESKIYSRAMKMVQLGADLEEIMRECELPRAEAELLFNLHQQQR